MLFSQRRMKSVAIAVIAAVAICGCSVVNPYVRAKHTPEWDAKSLPQSVRYAEDTRDAYFAAMQHHAVFNRSVGIALIGVSAAAIAVGASGGGSDTVTGLGIGGAGLFGVHQILYSPNRPRIYAAAANAINCSLASFSGLRTADSLQLDLAVDRLATAVRNLSNALNAPGVSTALEEIVLARGVLDASMVTLEQARKAQAELRTAGIRLETAVERIRGQANDALLKNEPDIAQLVSGLSKVIPLHAAMITGNEIPTLEDPSTKKSLSPADRWVVKAATEARIAALEVASLIAGLGSAPTVDQLEACGIDALESGLNFRVDPSTLVVAASASERKAVAVASGGKAPYYASWIDRTPGDEVTVEPIDHRPGNIGIVTVKVSASAKAGTYQLRIDDGRNDRTVFVRILGKSGSAAPSTPSTPSTPSAPATPATPATPAADEAAVKLQNCLRDLGCLAAAVPATGQVVNGAPAGETLAAFQKLCAKAGLSAQDAAAFSGEVARAAAFCDDAKQDTPPVSCN